MSRSRVAAHTRVAQNVYMRIIVNADDLGMSERTDDLTFSLMERGLVTSATIMANSPDLDRVLRLVPQFPRQSFGVHLNATVYHPLTLSPLLAPLLGATGCFEPIIQNVSISPALFGPLFREFSAQVETLLRQGIRISHIDSHQHIHTLPGVFPIVKAVQMKFHIPRIRITRNWYIPEARPGRLKMLQKQLFNTALRLVYPSRTTDGFADFLTFFRTMHEFGSMPFRSMELMVHPGAPPFAEEDNALVTDWQKTLGEKIQMISYAEL